MENANTPQNSSDDSSLTNPTEVRMLINNYDSLIHKHRRRTMHFDPDGSHLYFSDLKQNQLADITLSDVQGIIRTSTTDIEIITSQGTYEFDLQLDGYLYTQLEVLSTFLQKVTAVTNAPIVQRPFEIARYWWLLSILTLIVACVLSVNGSPLLWPCIGITLLFPLAADIRLRLIRRTNTDWRTWQYLDTDGSPIDPETHERLLTNQPKRSPVLSFSYVELAFAVVFIIGGVWAAQRHAEGTIVFYLLLSGATFGYGSLTQMRPHQTAQPYQIKKPFRFIELTVVLVLLVLISIIQLQAHTFLGIRP